MRLANVSGRAALVSPACESFVDVEAVTGGRFGPDPQHVLDRWPDFRRATGDVGFAAAQPLSRADLLAPVPSPRQVFAIGLNYRQHAEETNSTIPQAPLVFTKFVSAIDRPDASVVHPGGSVDWEVELVVAIGLRAYQVPPAEGWAYVAGVMVGQDISERELQHSGEPPQFSLGKSYPGFGPIGPTLVTVDELECPDDLALGCLVNGQIVQQARTSEMIFSVPELISRLSHIAPLLPGDLIFTGTPAGVGMGEQPPRFLSVDDELTSYVEGIGEIRNRMVASAVHRRPDTVPNIRMAAGVNRAG